MKKKSKTAIFSLLMLLFLSFPAQAEEVYADGLPRDWGVLAFPTLEKYNFFQFYLKFKESYLVALDETVAAGSKRALVAKTWSELEPKRGKYELDDLKEHLQWLEQRNQDLFLGLQLINTVKKETSTDLLDKAWDSPEMAERAIDIVRRMLALAPRNKLIYVSFGNEVDVYFEKNPKEVDPFVTLFFAVKKQIESEYPNAVLGITGTFEGFKNRRDILTRINRDTDVMMLTYYPLMHGGTQSPQSPHVDFPVIAEFANGKPVVLQEAGYPSSAVVGSSEEDQAIFIRELFKAWQDNAAAFPHINIFLQTDLGSRVCDKLMGYYDLESVKDIFVAHICTLGLKDAYGKPKKAWTMLIDEVAPALKDAK